MFKHLYLKLLLLKENEKRLFFYISKVREYIKINK